MTAGYEIMGTLVGDIDTVWDDAKAATAGFKAKLDEAGVLSLAAARDAVRAGLAMATGTIAYMRSPEYRSADTILLDEGAVPLWRLKWHEDEVAKEVGEAAASGKNLNAVPYKHADDLKKGLVATFSVSAGARAGRTAYDIIERDFWAGVKDALAKKAEDLAYAATHPLETATGIPAWAWWVGGGVLAVGVLGILGLVGYKAVVASGPVVVGSALRRFSR